MAINNLYRTWIPFYRNLSNTSPYEGPIWVKGNIQPYKTEASVYSNDGSFIEVRQESFRRVFIKDFPFEIEGGNDAPRYSYFFVDDGNTYRINNIENWTKAGRAPKHYQLESRIASANGWPDVPEPIPTADLVSKFERAVNRLTQTALIFEANPI